MIKRPLYINQIIPFIDKDIIKVLTGVRRSGKSVMLDLIIEELKERGVSHENIFLINFDSIKYQKIKRDSDLNDLILDLLKDKTEKVYLFFDEIQNVENWENSIRGFFVDFDCDIYLTGSNANLLSGELSTYLSGRYIQFKIYPFSFKEFLDFYASGLSNPHHSNLLKNSSGFSNLEMGIVSGSSNLEMATLDNDWEKINLSDDDVKSLFMEYVKVGGFPFLLNLDSHAREKYLEDVYSSIILRDIIKRNNIRDIDILERLIEYIMYNIGQTFSANSIFNYCKKEHRNLSPETIYNYLKYCENACLVEKVHREDIIGKKILNFKEKFYLLDHGLREAVLNSNIQDIERVLENIVYLELKRRNYDVFIGLIDDDEIDFVARKGKEKIYIQVAYVLEFESTVEREYGRLKKISDNYPKYVFTLDKRDYSQDGIMQMNIIDFLLSDDF